MLFSDCVVQFSTHFLLLRKHLLAHRQQLLVHLYEDDGTTINRHYYEMAFLTELREHIRAGDVSIVGSRQFRDFEEYLFSEDTWNQTKENTRLSVSLLL